MTARDLDRTPDAVKTTFKKMVGRTIKNVDVRTNPSRSKHVHHDERLTIEFTDGSNLVVVIGSNGDQIGDEHRGFTADELDLSFVPVFVAAGEAIPKRL